MKKVMIFIGVLIVSTLYADGQTTTNTKPTSNSEVVINKSMIERFNAVSYNENTTTYVQLKEQYSYEEIKLLYHAYHNTELDYTDKIKIDNTIAEIKAEINNPSHTIRAIIPLYTNN